jgi:hypothetical protein
VSHIPNAATVTGKACEGGYLVYDPYAWAPQGAQLRAHFEVKVTRGKVKLRTELVAASGAEALATGAPTKLKAGQRAVLEFYYILSEQLNGVEARLASEAKGGNADLVVSSGGLEILQ